MSKSTSIPFVHVSIELSLNDSGNRSWDSPRASQSVNFTIPLSMFDGKKLGDVIAAQAASLPALFEAEKAREALETAASNATSEAS